MRIKDTKTALELFEEASIKQAEATETGDYKTGNKYHAKIRKIATFLKNENAISSLKEYLTHLNVGVRLWTACYWLPIDEKEGIKVLKAIVKSPGIHSLIAETTIDEWKKDNLNF